ncbi:hypothetical protein HYW21_07875 [Candidatus Woesearchaeota archaeon]|nr:hypothetical protein [Candidatus Woesearchaeota archaeon]
MSYLLSLLRQGIAVIKQQRRESTFHNKEERFSQQFHLFSRTSTSRGLFKRIKQRLFLLINHSFFLTKSVFSHQGFFKESFLYRIVSPYFSRNEEIIATNNEKGFCNKCWHKLRELFYYQPFHILGVGIAFALIGNSFVWFMQNNMLNVSPIELSLRLLFILFFLLMSTNNESWEELMKQSMLLQSVRRDKND